MKPKPHTIEAPALLAWVRVNWEMYALSGTVDDKLQKRLCYNMSPDPNTKTRFRVSWRYLDAPSWEVIYEGAEVSTAVCLYNAFG